MSANSGFALSPLQNPTPPCNSSAVSRTVAVIGAGPGGLVAARWLRAAGVEPDLSNWPHIRRALLFGPLAPSCFRLEGPDALPDAAIRFERDAAAFGAITSNELTKRESKYWALVQAATSLPG